MIGRYLESSCHAIIIASLFCVCISDISCRGGSQTLPYGELYGAVMLNLFWRLLTAILIPCALALSALLLIAQRQPLPTVQSGLALCDVPCWAGLEPGRTPTENVPDVIQTHLGEATFQRYQRYTQYVVDVPARS